MASYNFSNYSFSNSLKSLTDPFRQLIKKPAATSTPSALFTPAPKAPVTPSLNYSPYTPAPNMSTATGPKYAPSITTTPTPIAPKPPVSAPTPPLNPAVPQIAPTAIPTAPPVAPGTQESAPGATSDQVSPETTKALGLAESAYQRSLQISPEELSTQEDLDKLIESTKTAYRNTSGQAIPMEFITGQLRSIEQRATGLAEPLERKLSRLQAARTSSLEASKFALERADKSIQSEKDASKPVAGTSFYDPRTGKFTQAPAAIPKADPFTLSPGDKRYDDKGNLIASGGEKPMSDAAEAKLIEKAAEKTEKEESSRQAATLSIGAVNNLLSGDRYKAIAGVVQTGSIRSLEIVQPLLNTSNSKHLLLSAHVLSLKDRVPFPTSKLECSKKHRVH